jgi:hypothetical protein
MAYNFAKRLNTLKGLTPYEYICKIWTTQPERFTVNPAQHDVGRNTCQTSNTPFTIASVSLQPAEGSACTARKSTSQPSSPVKNSASRKSTTAFGSSTL